MPLTGIALRAGHRHKRAVGGVPFNVRWQWAAPLRIGVRRAASLSSGTGITCRLRVLGLVWLAWLRLCSSEASQLCTERESKECARRRVVFIRYRIPIRSLQCTGWHNYARKRKAHFSVCTFTVYNTRFFSSLLWRVDCYRAISL